METQFFLRYHNPSAALNVKNKIRNTVLKFDDVAGIGVPKCDSETGAIAQNSHNLVSCVAIYVETYEAYQNLLGLYPTGTKINGVFVTIVPTGELKLLRPGLASGLVCKPYGSSYVIECCDQAGNCHLN